MAHKYTPVVLSGKRLKVQGKAMDKAAAVKRVKKGKDVYATKGDAKALSKAIGGGRRNVDGDYTIKESSSGKKGQILFEHFHDPHRKEREKSGRSKMGHIFFGDGYEMV